MKSRLPGYVSIKCPMSETRTSTQSCVLQITCGGFDSPYTGSAI